MDSDELLELRKELFNIKVALKKMKFDVLYNSKSKRYEHYKVSEIRKLRNKIAKENN